MRTKGKKIIGLLSAPCKDREGQGLIELVIVIPFLILLIYGIADLGKALNASLILENASREGALAASKLDVNPSAINPAVKNHVLDFIKYANAAPAEWIDPRTCSVAWSNRYDSATPVPNLIRYVTVKVECRFKFQYFHTLVKNIPGLASPEVTLKAETTMPVVKKT